MLLSERFPFDNPPKPQDPPIHHTPLTPRRSRGNLKQHSPSFSNPTFPTSSISSQPRLHTPRGASIDGTTSTSKNSQPSRPIFPQSTVDPRGGRSHRGLPVTKGDSRITTSSVTRPPFDKNPLEFLGYVSSSPAEGASTPRLGADEVESGTILDGARGDISINKDNVVDQKTKTTTAIPTPTPIPTTTTTTILKPAASVIMSTPGLLSRDDDADRLFDISPLSAGSEQGNHSKGSTSEQVKLEPNVLTIDLGDTEDDTDWRSLISSVLEVYYNSTGGTSTEEDRWSSTEEGSIDTLEDNLSVALKLQPSEISLNTKPTSSPIHPPRQVNLSRRQRPTTLGMEPVSKEEQATRIRDLPAMPQTAPAASLPRPLPPLPNVLTRSQTRPLPRPPVSPPEYQRVPSTAPSSWTSQFPPQSPEKSSLSGRRARLPPLLVVLPRHDCGPSPLTPGLPVPPSPMTARRHQATKLSKILGEDIPVELLCARGKQQPPPPLPPPPPPPLPIGIADPIRTESEDNNTRLSLAVGSRADDDRPRAIYVDDISEESDGDGSLEDGTHKKVRVGFVSEQEGGEDVWNSDRKGLFDASPSPSDSLFDDDLDDFEEVHISWALHTAVTYETPSRVKRTSRMWVLEKNGQRREAESYDNVLSALREL